MTRSRAFVLITLGISLALASLSPLGVSQAQAPRFEIKLAHADPPDVYTSRKAASSTVFKQIVESETGGAVAVNLYPAGQLGGETQLAQAVKLGTLQMAMVSGAFSQFCREAQVFDMPYLFPSYTVAWKVLDGPFGQELAKQCLQETGMRILEYGQVGFRNFTNSVRPIRTPADLKGLKIRVQPAPVYLALVKSMGASPTPVEWTETYSALQQKVVDGEENPVSTIQFAKLYEVQKYLTLDGHTYGVSFMLINEKFFQGLPKNIQAIVQDAARTAQVVEDGDDTLNSSIGIQFLQNKGMDVYVPTAAQMAQFKAVAQPAVMAYLEKQIGRAWIDKALRAVKEAEASLEK
ncbi:MAG TPA: DctP family TRAP transporter solute-binding subunit [bacterium]|nr:DctP family TRAP transporter solute-binding subunit [bacterium]